MVQIRSAKPEDAELIYQFIYHKAEFDRNLGGYSGEIKTTVENIRQTLFKDRPFAFVLIAEAEVAIGFALYYFRYSSFAGVPSIWLDDLFINPDMRNHGAGTLLMNRLLQIAKDNNCSRMPRVVRPSPNSTLPSALALICRATSPVNTPPVWKVRIVS